MDDGFLFNEDLTTLDPAIADLIGRERERQLEKLILIPSESVSPLAVRQALASEFMHVYAEGYPNPHTRQLTQQEILDYDRFLAHYRRYGDGRYYRGVEYADVAEALARRRGAEALATDAISADQIFVNVQPLSGAPANLAVQQALLEPGDTIMGMALAYGGHLTHGSAANLSGQRHKVVSYHVDEETELLDYDEIEALALEHHPQMIIAGYTSYPHQPDWMRFRQIADRVGAYLLADIAHVAGMVIAGVHSNPLAHAHVTTFTTHKTLCGPRGACILTADPQLARRIDRVVFPGLQGGPHVNKFVAMAVAFELTQTTRFRRLQHQIVLNAKHLAQALGARGLRLPYGGTETHLLLVDCKTVRGRDGTPLMGDVLARILDLIGVVVNKNTIPGDTSAIAPSGIRLGTPWVTQRGLQKPEMEQIADIIARTMAAIEPFSYVSARGPGYRGKIDFDLLQELRQEVSELIAASSGGGKNPDICSLYPQAASRAQGTEDEWRLVDLEGEVADQFVEQAVQTDLADLKPKIWRPAALLNQDGRAMSPVAVRRPQRGYDRYQLAVPSDRAQQVLFWLRGLSDGFVRFDTADLLAKVPGPVAVRDEREVSGGVPRLVEAKQAGLLSTPSHKPYFVGLSGTAYEEEAGELLPDFQWEKDEGDGLRRTPLFDWQEDIGAHMAPFAGWELPLWYTSVVKEHHAVRERAGLFDIAHMGVLEVRGPHAAYFLNLTTTNDVNALQVGESQYSYLLTPDGQVLDDLMIYRLGARRYMLVTNAANSNKDWAWLQAVNERKVCIDRSRPWVWASFQADLKNYHAQDLLSSDMAALAIQGPLSDRVLLAFVEASIPVGEMVAVRARLAALQRSQVTMLYVSPPTSCGSGFDLVIARTGYTGESIGFEIFASAQELPGLWRALLEVGEPMGLQPAGLAARDSLRIEAGLPLYGHELAGPLDLRPDEAGFSRYVKLHKPFFVGRRAYIEHSRGNSRTLVRFKLDQKNTRRPRLEDIVADKRGRVIGRVTSCAMGIDGHLVGQAFVDRRHAKVGEKLSMFPQPIREDWEKPYEQLEIGDRLVLHSDATVVSRFMKK